MTIAILSLFMYYYLLLVGTMQILANSTPNLTFRLGDLDVKR